MAIDTFLKLGDVDGESQDATHSKSIDVLSWSWGMSQSGTTHMGGGGGGGKVNVQDIVFSKFVDSSTPTIMKFCCSGKHFEKGTLTVRKAGDNPVEYLKVEMEDIIISSYGTGGSGDGLDRVQETIGLNFAKCKTIYTMQEQDGTAGKEIPHGWDIQKNELWA